MDIRWIQRFESYSKALEQLSRFIEKGALNELEQQGLIQAFEYNYELAWNTIKDYFDDQGGNSQIFGSRDAFRLAFNRGLIQNGEAWMEMVKSRALTSHTYNQETANKVTSEIKNIYFREFKTLHESFAKLKQKENKQ